MGAREFKTPEGTLLDLHRADPASFRACVERAAARARTKAMGAAFKTIFSRRRREPSAIAPLPRGRTA